MVEGAGLKLRICVVNHDYGEFLQWLYVRHKGLENSSFEEQLRVRNESLFGVADFYSSNLRKLGHETWDIYFNNEFMQEAWTRKYGARRSLRWLYFRRAGLVPRMSRGRKKARLYDLLAGQLEYYKPDVLLNLAMDGIHTSFLPKLRKHGRFLIGLGQPPVILRKGENWRLYDLILAPSEGAFDHFAGLGIKTELLRFGFEPRVLSVVERNRGKTIPVSFVGSIGERHSRRRSVLEKLCQAVGDQIYVWAPATEEGWDPALRERYQGSAWGVELYRILAASKITLNYHIDVAGQAADNMRMYEATGMGSMLVTDWKENLGQMFEPGKEVLAYRDPEECAEILRRYLANDAEREAIARAGQGRTLAEHTYEKRMEEFTEILRRYM